MSIRSILSAVLCMPRLTNLPPAASEPNLLKLRLKQRVAERRPSPMARRLLKHHRKLPHHPAIRNATSEYAVTDMWTHYSHHTRSLTPPQGAPLMRHLPCTFESHGYNSVTCIISDSPVSCDHNKTCRHSAPVYKRRHKYSLILTNQTNYILVTHLSV